MTDLMKTPAYYFIYFKYIMPDSTCWLTDSYVFLIRDSKGPAIDFIEAKGEIHTDTKCKKLIVKKFKKL